MIEIKDFTSISDLDEVRKLWNEEVGFIFPITEKLFNHHVVNSLYLAPNASYGAYLDNKLVGVIITKTYSGDEISAYNDRAWISLFYVSKYFRRRGVGSLLLEKVIDEVKKMGKKMIQIGQDLGNFFPGIPCDFDNLTASFLEKRGFKMLGYTHDLLLKEPFNKEIVIKNDLEYRYATLSDKEELLKFMEKNFPGRWNFELKEYYKNETKFNNYFIARDKEKVVGFVRVNRKENENISYNINWYDRFNDLIGIGPLGVDKDERGKGISKEMISVLLKELADQGKNEVLIDWTSLLVYYQQFGFEVWKCYMKAIMTL